MGFTYPNHNFILNKRLKSYCRKILTLTLIGILSSCRSSASKTTSPEPSLNTTPEQTPGLLQETNPKTTSPKTTAPQGETVNLETTSPQDAPAIISEIQSQPVWLRRLKALSEISAQQGMGMQIGETIRTEGNALAQINLKNGLAFRIGGNAVLTLQPDNRLNLSAGEMITWVTPGKKVPTQVITPGGVAGIRGTTIHVKMPKNPKDAIEFFTWEGTMFIRLPNKTEEFQLKAGEIVKIKPGETNINKIRESVRRLTNQEWSNRRHNSPLINKFDQPLPTLQKIDKTAHSVPKINSSTPSVINPPASSKTRSSTISITPSPSPQIKPSTNRITISPSPQIMPTVTSSTGTPTTTKKIISIPQNTPSKDDSSTLKPLPKKPRQDD
jgi:hypothetical protein